MITDRSKVLVKAITLDLDGTLWDDEPEIAEAERTVHARLACYHPPVAQAFSIDDLRTLRGELAACTPRLRHDVTELRKACMRVAARQAGADPAIAEEAFRVFMRHRNRVELYDDTLPALKALRQHYLLCSLTNGNADLDEIGLRSMFKHSLSAAPVGAAKPAPDMFEQICRVAGVRPDEVVHVGDEPDTDIAGAAAAGCRTVWVNRRDASWPYGWRPDAEIRSLAELQAALTVLQHAAIGSPPAP
jgi:putative hydrolase of the HAD superfamily